MTEHSTGSAHRGSQGWFALLGLGVYTVLSLSLGAGFAIPVGIMGAIGVAFLGPLGRLIADRVGPGPSADGASQEQIEYLNGRILELEERLDFAERLLTQQRDNDRLPSREIPHGH